VDQVLPNTFNQVSGQPNGMVLVHAWSDREPSRWYLLDVPGERLKLLAVGRPGLDPAKARPMEALRYAARDGLSIPAYLTRPDSGPGPQPLVVVVHGGPATRDHWGWEDEVQLLAAQGYVVFQPQFRGSTGFGLRFERAGWRQWGQSMQDDITDGVQHLVDQGIADPARICIYGASYGGYAAVWGLAKTPDLYRCGVSFAGVADIGHMMSDQSDANANRHAREWRRLMVGSVDADAAQFDAVSPLKHAARIRAPLFIAHGLHDERVPISHAEKLRQALDRAGKPYEWLELSTGHGLHDSWSERQFLEKLLAFLSKHLAQPAAAQGPSSKASGAPGR
jgi:dipeptidyl aminopeptidase/acylaminoacyl peptidase